MKKILRIIIFFNLTSCISTTNINIIPRKDIMEVVKKEKKPYKKILVQWKNYSYTDFHKVSNLEKTLDEIKLKEIDEKLYIKFKSRALKLFKENGLYDEIKGEGTIKILLITYGRWDYNELLTTYLTDTPYILIFPSSLSVKYKLTVKAEREDGNLKFEDEAIIKTTFFIPLLPLYPLFTYSGREKTLLDNMIYKTILELSKKSDSLSFHFNNEKSFIESK